MKTDADDGGANAKPPLVRAPCWICLEEGPDEAGEPLVRDCACRGETSAGYHLSCIFAYAKRRIAEAVKRRLEHGPPVNDERSNLINSYTRCPNCTTPYMSKFAPASFERVLELTQNLPDTHYVRYDIVEYAAQSLFNIAKNSETTTVNTDMMMTAICQLKDLRNLVICDNEKVVSLAVDVRFRESTKLLRYQAQMLWDVADVFKQEGKDHERLYADVKNVFETVLEEIDKYENDIG